MRECVHFLTFIHSIIEIMPHSNGPRARNHHRPSSLQIVGIARTTRSGNRSNGHGDQGDGAIYLLLLFIMLNGYRKCRLTLHL